MQQASNFTHLSANQLAEQLDNDHYVVLDIRDANTFSQGRIPGAIHLTNESLADFMREADFDKPTVVCCYHGISSQPAADFLHQQDFTEVYSLDGGFTQWQQLFPEKIEK